MSLAHDYRAELSAQQAERRARLWAPNPSLRLIKAKPNTAVLGEQNEHVIEWRIHEAVTEAMEGIAQVMRPWRKIILAVLAGTGVTMKDLISDRRQAPLVRVRHAVMYRLATETTMSYPQIGRALGNRDHTTVMHGVRAHALRNGLPVPVGLRR